MHYFIFAFYLKKREIKAIGGIKIRINLNIFLFGDLMHIYQKKCRSTDRHFIVTNKIINRARIYSG